MADPSVLDNPALSSLTGPHAHFALGHAPVLRYPADVSPFVALPSDPDAAAWRALAALLGPEEIAAAPGLAVSPPADWEVALHLPGVQMVDEGMDAVPDDEAVALGRADVPEMLALVERTKPGPFLPRTVELGTYLGIRRDGDLVAMAGERMHLPGYTEVSAVCTDERFQGQGLGARLVRAVAVGIRARGEVPMLHAAATNTGAIHLYQRLGFVTRRTIDFVGLVAPSG